MTKHLYDIFAHWNKKGSLYFYGDTHFDDKEMIFLREGVSNEFQIKSINSKVSKNDTIVFLGDIGNPEHIKKIRGYKVLVLGNHDKGATNYKEYFDEIYEGALMISDKIILSHEPLDFKYALNIHGHDHSNWFKGKQHLNVCAELINYVPVSLKQVVESGMLKEIPNIHRITVNKAKERNKKNVEQNTNSQTI